MCFDTVPVRSGRAVPLGSRVTAFGIPVWRTPRPVERSLSDDRTQCSPRFQAIGGFGHHRDEKPAKLDVKVNSARVLGDLRQDAGETCRAIQLSFETSTQECASCAANLPRDVKVDAGTGTRRRARDRGTRATPVREQGADWNRADVFHTNFSRWLLPAGESLSKQYDESVTAMAEVQVSHRTRLRSTKKWLPHVPLGQRSASASMRLNANAASTNPYDALLETAGLLGKNRW